MTFAHKYSKDKKNYQIRETLSRNIQNLNLNKNLISSSNKKLGNLKSRKYLHFNLINRIKEEILIEWKDEDREIYLVGNIGNFNKFFVSKKNKRRYINLYSNKYIQKLKFKVDGNLKISYIYFIYNKFNALKDKENLSLFYDKRNLSTSTKDSSLLLENKNNIQNKNDENENLIFAKKNFCNYFPKKYEMKDKADKKPCHFPTETFHGINSFHNEIGNKKYLILKDNNIFNSNTDSYKNIDKKEHILLNHLFQKIVNKKIINSFTIKYRHKNSTFIYYN